MRVQFDLQVGEPMTFAVDGIAYKFSGFRALAIKEHFTTGVFEYVFQLPTGQHVYLTVVSADETPSAYGVSRGWYVAEKVSADDAAFLMDAYAKFTAAHQSG